MEVAVAGSGSFFPLTTVALLWPCPGEAALPRALSSAHCLTRIAMEGYRAGVPCCPPWGYWEGLCPASCWEGG